MGANFVKEKFLTAIDAENFIEIRDTLQVHFLKLYYS